MPPWRLSCVALRNGLMFDHLALVNADRGSVVAPAGCGKTELIVRAVKSMTRGRALVLTHTHAGVKALRDRLKRLDLGSAHAQVETIAGFCLRYANAYPKASDFDTPEPVGSEWENVYEAAQKLFSDVHAIRRVIQSSYSGVFVDEYQDCTMVQHQLVTTLADIMPCRVLGDPLQGIFGFAGGNLSWKGDVEAAFPSLGELNKPWRWSGKNEALGNWLLDIRKKLIRGQEIDLSAGPVIWAESTPGNQRAEAYRLVKSEGRVVAIRKWAREAHSFARTLGGLYPSMEEMDCKDLLKFAEDMDKHAGARRAARIVRFASECMSEVSTVLEDARRKFEAGRLPSLARIKNCVPAIEALIATTKTNSAETVRIALDFIAEIPGAKVFRRELWQEARRALLAFDRGTYTTIHQAAWASRNRLRIIGRALDTRLVSRTLLIKGLEFEHALILDADELEDPRQPGDGAKNFYVAATRGSRSLVVLSAQPKVKFRTPKL